MIRKAAIALALGAAAIGAAGAASAQFYRNYDHSYRWNGDMPRGSWERTCNNARMNGPILRARCDNGHGRWVYTSIDVRGCPGDRIRNTWGQLTCAANGYRGGYDDRYRRDGWRGGMPSGSWAETCHRSSMSGPVLNAVCDDGHGRWLPSSIDVRQCNGRVKNSWGRLTCD